MMKVTIQNLTDVINLRKKKNISSYSHEHNNKKLKWF